MASQFTYLSLWCSYCKLHVRSPTLSSEQANIPTAELELEPDPHVLPHGSLSERDGERTESFQSAYPHCRQLVLHTPPVSSSRRERERERERGKKESVCQIEIILWAECEG